jgi:hypothetical protein
MQLQGKQRSSVARTGLTARDAGAVVDAALRFTALAPGSELPESGLPGQHAD